MDVGFLPSELSRTLRPRAVRCLQCGETRWTLFPSSLEHSLERPCELCGGETVLERRRPGSGPRRLAVERRGGRWAATSQTGPRFVAGVKVPPSIFERGDARKPGTRRFERP
jgi:hypothetical protein